MVTKMPRLFGAMYKVGGWVSSRYIKSPVYFANVLNKDNLRRFISENGFDTVVMPHLFPAEAMTAIRKKESGVRSVVIATDYTCIPFWEETKPDVFILPHIDLVKEYAHAGIPESRLLPLGIPVSERFNMRTDKHEARRQLGIREDRPCVLIMSGSMGFGDAGALIRGLLEKYADGISIVLLGGSNRQLKESVRTEFGGRENVTVVDFTPPCKPVHGRGGPAAYKAGRTYDNGICSKEYSRNTYAPHSGVRNKKFRVFCLASYGGGLSGVQNAAGMDRPPA